MTTNPSYRFTFFNSLYPSGVIVNAPIGWRNAEISLKRHEKYHSLLEYFKGSFLWYGSAREIIREVEADQGADAELRCLIEINFGTGWDTVFDGLIDIIQQEDLSKGAEFYKQQVPIIQNDFWAKFINRKKSPVDLEASVDLDGNARTPIAKTVLPLPSQVIRNRTTYVGADGIAGSDVGVVNSERTAQIGLPRVLGEIKDSYQIGFSERPNNLEGLINVIEVKEQGDIVFTVAGEATIQANSTQNFAFSSAQIAFMRVGQTQIISSTEEETTNSIDRTHDLSGVRTLNAEIGDLIYIYVVWNVSHEDVGPTTGNINFIFNIDLDIEAVQNSTMPDSETDCFLIKDAAESIVSKITGYDNTIVSEALDGCLGNRVITKGKNIRGYSFDEKEPFMTFEDWEEGALNQLGLGIGHIGNQIEIEKIEDFYDPDFVVSFSNVTDLVRTYDMDKFYKTITAGYQKWSSESESGIDDPQTKRVYNTRFKTIGNEKNILSKWIAASLVIERVRRNRVELGKDDRNDEDIFSICVQSTESGYTPELAENFDSVTNLLNYPTRYNMRDSVARVMLRWKKYLQSCLNVGDFFFFASGEGNYEMASTLNSGDCEAGAIAENQDIETDAGLFKPMLYKAKIPVSWEEYQLIKANKKKAIGISRTSTGHQPCFIVDFDYKLSHGNAEILLLLGGNEL